MVVKMNRIPKSSEMTTCQKLSDKDIAQEFPGHNIFLPAYNIFHLQDIVHEKNEARCPLLKRRVVTRAICISHLDHRLL